MNLGTNCSSEILCYACLFYPVNTVSTLKTLTLSMINCSIDFPHVPVFETESRTCLIKQSSNRPIMLNINQQILLYEDKPICNITWSPSISSFSLLFSCYTCMRLKCGHFMDSVELTYWAFIMFIHQEQAWGAFFLVFFCNFFVFLFYLQ